MILEFRALVRKRRALLLAILILVFLVIITTIFTYPGQIWFVAIIGGAVSIAGTFLKEKILITLGIVGIGATFYLSNLGWNVSLFNIILLTAFFMLFYGADIYVYEFSRLDIILKETKGEADKHLVRYMKKWRFTAVKYLVVSFLVAATASIVSLAASFDQSIYHGQMIPFAASVLFAVSALVLTFILIVKLPTLYDNLNEGE